MKMKMSGRGPYASPMPARSCARAAALVFAVFLPAVVRAAAARDRYLLAVARGEKTPPNSAWPPLSREESALFKAKAAGWIEHALRESERPAGHIQWGHRGKAC